MKASLTEKILGTWYLQSILMVADSKSTEMFGPNPKGIAMFDSGGNVSTQMGAWNRESIPQENIHQLTNEAIKHAFDSYMAFSDYIPNQNQARSR
ncbi:MAG: lipocalin-like domain-containing protein [Bacteroidetes bacterium]|nr:lipocalin-like domain-containing protein [Bacteroidota bacterium]